MLRSIIGYWASARTVAATKRFAKSGIGQESGAKIPRSWRRPIDGGLGDDTLTGGPGRDQFVFDTALGPTNIDRITNFQHHIDKIDLSHAIFTKAGAIGTLTAAAFFEGTAAHDASDRIIYNPANGHVIYDSNGNHGLSTAASNSFNILGGTG
jgi:Ca2+-binding RTX toxin-like protein